LDRLHKANASAKLCHLDLPHNFTDFDSSEFPGDDQAVEVATYHIVVQDISSTILHAMVASAKKSTAWVLVYRLIGYANLT
jgi:hypothetical protein